MNSKQQVVLNKIKHLCYLKNSWGEWIPTWKTNYGKGRIIIKDRKIIFTNIPYRKKEELIYELKKINNQLKLELKN
jgi:hypothetical protein